MSPRRLTSMPYNLIFLTCDDWMIYARDRHGYVWYVVTELWPEWENYDHRELNAVAKYMLPIAFRRWNSLPWQQALDDNDRPLHYESFFR